MSNLREVLLLLVALGCQRDVAAVLSVYVEGPDRARTREILVDLDLGEGPVGFSFPVDGEPAALRPPKRVDLTFRERELGTGWLEVRADDEASGQPLRGCTSVVIREGLNEASVSISAAAPGCEGGAGGAAGGGGSGGAGGSGAGAGGPDGGAADPCFAPTTCRDCAAMGCRWCKDNGTCRPEFGTYCVASIFNPDYCE